MTMEEIWNMRASSIKSSAQPGQSAINQFNMDPGQGYSQPYMAKEVCVIERTFRQEPMLPNTMASFGSQGLHPDKLRSELLAMVSGSQQQQQQHLAKPSYTSSLSGRSPYAASLSQFNQMNLPDFGGYSGWPLQIPQPNRGDGSAKSSTGADAPLGQGRDFSSVLTGGRSQDSLQAANGSRASTAELLTHSSLSFGKGTGELGMEGSWHLPSSQWSTEPARQRQQQQQQRNQSSSTLFSTNSGDPCKGVAAAPLNMTASSFLNQSSSAPPPTSSGGLRVYCMSYCGVPVVGQLGLTGGGRLGVTCNCHSQHMSVAKFSQHSSLNVANPGEVVYLEGGETLVQWRKSFFSQYGVKVPEDSVGWEWTDVVPSMDVGPPIEAGHSNGKYKAAASVTRCWQKEVDVSCGGSPSMMKSRTTTQQMWDASLSNGNASSFMATESISNTKHGLLSSAGNNGGMLDSREPLLKSYGQSQKTMAPDPGSGNQFYSANSLHENHYSRAQVNMGANSTFHSMSHVPMSNTHNGLMSNGGSPRYNSLTRPQQQVSSGMRPSVKGTNYPGPTRLSETGQESRMREADISSSFELRLGQPSQQTQAAGTSFSSLASSSVDYPKSHSFEQSLSKVWDGKLLHNLQQFNPANLPKFSGVPGHARDQDAAQQSVHGRTEYVERRGEERGSAAANLTAISQSTRQLSHNPSQARYRADGVSELQEKLMSLESLQNQSDMSSRSGDRQFRREPSGSEKLAAKLFPHTAVGPARSVALENRTTLDSLSSGALEQLSKKTGQRLLETAIQSSFSYRAMGLEGPAAGAPLPNGMVPSTTRAEGQLFSQLDAYGRSSCVSGQRASFQEILVRSQLGQNQAELECELALASANVSTPRVEQDPNLRAFPMRDQPGLSFMKQQHSVQRLVVEDCSERRGMLELKRGLGAPQEPQIRQSLLADRNRIAWRSEEQGSVTGRYGRGQLLGDPGAESTAHPGLESSKVERLAEDPSRLSQGHGEHEGKEGDHMDVRSQPVPDLVGRDARGLATDAVSPEVGLDVPALSGGDVQCSCLKCRKASPSVRGQAVPRLVGQVCLKEKAGLASMMDAARKVALDEGEHNRVEGSAQIEQPAKVDMETRKSALEEEGAECDNKGTPENEDVMSDTAAKGTAGAAAAAAAEKGSAQTEEATSDVGVCSNSSENVSSGLSDGGYVLSEKAGPGAMQGSGVTGVPGVVDEGSGIGKCCSSDGVDMGVGRQTNALSSALEDHCKVEGSPSSLGCPSSSNIRQRLGVKRSGMKGHAGGGHGRTEMDVDNEVEGNEPALNTGKMEIKQRRSTKWKWLGSGGADDGDAKEGSPRESSFEQDPEPQLTSETARMGSKNMQEAATRLDGSKSDLGRAWSGEMVPSSKRRKLLVPRRHQEVKATNETGENLPAKSLGQDESKKKAGTTLVIRVPQGVNRQKAKMGVRTKLQQPKSDTPRDWKVDGMEKGRDGRRELEAGKLPASRATALPMKDGPGPGPGPERSGAVVVPNFLTKSIRSPRTPLAGPSPRNGRMVSLSVILNQPAAASLPVPRAVEGPLARGTRDGVASSISRKEGAPMQKRAEAHAGSGSGVTGGQVKEVKNRSGPSDLGVAWKATESSRTRVVQKKDDAQSRKVRSMLELTGKNVRSMLGLTGKNDAAVHGPVTSSVFEFAEEENHVAATPRAAGKHHHTTASAAVQTDSPAAGLGRVGAKSCPFPRGERSARPGISNRRKVEWHFSKDAQAEAPGKSSTAGAERLALEKGGTYVCKVSQVRSTAGSSISKEKLQQGFGEQGFPVRKQVRSSKAKRSNTVAMDEGALAKERRGGPVEGVRVSDNQKVRQVQVAGQLQMKGGITGNGVLKRRPELLLQGMSTKRPRVEFTSRKVKEGVVGETKGAMTSGEQLKSSIQRGSCFEQKKNEPLVEDAVASSGKIPKRDKSQILDVNGRSSTWEKEKGGGGVRGTQLGQGEKCRCDVCGSPSSASYNKLLSCGRCPVKVHQACYGVLKVPKGPWLCRICKFKVTNPICVLCGYGGGAMTRVQKARPLCQALLQTWREMKNENACALVLEEDDDDETLLSATNSMQLSRASSVGGTSGISAKKRETTKPRECESCDCVDTRDNEGSVCKLCGKENTPEPGSSGGNAMMKGSERGAVVVATSGREDWRRSNTVGCIVKDPGAKQWAHMVCTLWMPGTRCLNMGTMGVFDVSGVTASRRKALCSMCQRKGGASIQCRVPKCSTPFHVWCAHEKGLLQSETVQDGSNQVSFFGKCQKHADYCATELEDETKEGPNSGSREICARTEGYKGRLTLEERAKAQQRMILEGSAAVTHEQVAAWLRIDERKLSTRRSVKPANSSMKCDQREYLRFKQKKGWKKLGVYKSGIHALGLYTTDFIAEGEVVVEYVGEIVGLRVADKREAEYHSGKRLQYQSACYLFRIDMEQIIDATRKGGIARFVNHSCSPNCVAKVICVENLKKVVFFAKRDIYAKEEITYDYKFNCDEVGDKIPCFCGTPECRGTLN